MPPGDTPSRHLRALTEAGLARRFPDGVPDKVCTMVEHELALIAELEYEPYFLTVHDIVRFARSRGILCQGRGSAANSAVCYASASPKSTRRAWPCCSSASFRASATSRPTSTSISSTSGARK